MISKNDVRDAILDECDILVHLYGKLPKDALDYRPTPKQRSTLELLRYLTYAGVAGIGKAVDGTYAVLKEGEKRTSEMRAEEFPAAMERQKKAIIAAFDKLTEAQLATQESSDPLGRKMSLGRALLAMPLRWMTAYRMQLFLYAKAAGNHEIGTANTWAGIDWPRK